MSHTGRRGGKEGKGGGNKVKKFQKRPTRRPCARRGFLPQLSWKKRGDKQGIRGQKEFKIRKSGERRSRTLNCSSHKVELKSGREDQRKEGILGEKMRRGDGGAWIRKMVLA